MLKIKRMQIHTKSMGLKQMVKIKQKVKSWRGGFRKQAWDEVMRKCSAYLPHKYNSMAPCLLLSSWDCRFQICPAFLFHFDDNTLCLPSGFWNKTALSVIYLGAIKPQKLSVVFLLMYTTRTCHSTDIVQRENGLPSKYITRGQWHFELYGARKETIWTIHKHGQDRVKKHL